MFTKLEGRIGPSPNVSIRKPFVSAPSAYAAGRTSERFFGVSSSLVLFIAALSFMFAVLASSKPSFGGVDPAVKQSKTVIVKKIAVLPFENLSETPRAVIVINDLVREGLVKMGYTLTVDEMEGFLARRRIRQTNSVTRLVAREMGKTLGVDAVLVGAITAFNTVERGSDAKVGVSMRLVSALDGSIIWADDLAYSGRDFERFLGLGIIKSADKLASVVIGDIVKAMPQELQVNDNGLSPFEAAGVFLTPPKARSGEKVRLKAHVLPIADEPKVVKAVVDGQEVLLTREEGTEFYDGLVIGPLKEGVHAVDLVALDQEMQPFVFKASGKLVINNTPPDVSVAVNKTVFSPQKKGSIVFSPVMRNLSEVEEWRIEIFDNSGKLVRSDNGFGKLPKKLIWRGETNKFRQVDDGDYTYVFTVKDGAGNKTKVKGDLRVKNAPPKIRVDVKMEEDKLSFMFTPSVKGDVIASWKLTIVDDKGNVVGVFNGKGALPGQVAYPVDKSIDLNRLSIIVSATDDAGNSAELKKAIPSVLVVKQTPFARLNGNGRPIYEDF
ncbi:MAG: hypothetical protein HY886_05645 [Deltaproteobacteria bacterium]|nr:hypothetical protein [Deltaproteobacteria bacterium]